MHPGGGDLEIVGREVRGERLRAVKCPQKEVAWELKNVKVGEDWNKTKTSGLLPCPYHETGIVLEESPHKNVLLCHGLYYL